MKFIAMGCPMTDAELETVGKLCDLLRARGVRIWKGADCEIEMGELPVPDVKQKALETHSKLEQAAEVCPCGHAEYEHQSGLCLRGCDVESCQEKETKK